MRYEVSYVEHGHAIVANTFALRLFVDRLDHSCCELGFVEASRDAKGYGVTFRRTWKAEFAAGSSIEAVRTFLHMSDLPDDLDHRKIEVAPLVEELALESDDQRAESAA